jgi:hypothetical protein
LQRVLAQNDQRNEDFAHGTAVWRKATYLFIVALLPRIKIRLRDPVDPPRPENAFQTFVSSVLEDRRVTQGQGPEGEDESKRANDQGTCHDAGRRDPETQNGKHMITLMKSLNPPDLELLLPRDQQSKKKGNKTTIPGARRSRR